MLFSKPISDLDHHDIEEFCTRFRENIRVEYKSTFDDSVKRKLPKTLSSFANSYGGVLVIGVKTTSGVPEEPFEGIAFQDPEPRLTVENVCRDNIFPEVLFYAQLVPSQVSGKAFLVIQVNESPKAPHAIENSTQVYVRTGDSASPTKLADMALLERLLLRRREVSARWDEFFAESSILADRAGIRKDVPLLELQIGPLYPTDVVIQREKVFEFLADDLRRRALGFYKNESFRHPAGALLSRDDEHARYLNIGELGTIHYLEPLEPTRCSDLGLDGATDMIYQFWNITRPIIRVLTAAGHLALTHSVCCALQSRARLINVSKLRFTHSRGSPVETLPVFTLSAVAPAWTTCGSELLSTRIKDVTVELLYQLRWLFGTQSPHTRDQIRPIVERESKLCEVPYPTGF